MQSGLGRGLFAAVQSSSNEEDIQPFLHAWRQQLQHELSVDPSHTLGRRCIQVANSVNDRFPPWQAMANYVRPIMAQHPNGVPAAWIPHLPDITKITRLCERLFTWGTKAGIQAKLAELVWPGACTRRLLRVRCQCCDSKADMFTWLQPPDVTSAIEAWNDGVVFDTIPSMSDFLGIVREKQGDRDMPGTRLFFVKTNRHMLDATVASGIRGDRQQPKKARQSEKPFLESPTKQKRARCRADPFFKGVWFPAALIEHALPRVVLSFDSQKSRTDRPTPRSTKKVSLHASK